jgi:5'-nucleotidase
MLTNDDGIASPGLLALIHALHPLGELLVVAPRHQQSATSRSHLQQVGATEHHLLDIAGVSLRTYSVEATPAQAVRNGLLRFAPRKPDLLISGINYGENVGAGLTVSGTVGAAWEGAAMGVPALAVSLEVEFGQMFQHSTDVDFSVAAQIAKRFAAAVLANGLPKGVEILNINVPEDAAPDVGWQLTRVSGYSHFHTVVRENERGEKVFDGYHRKLDFNQVEAQSDIHVLFKDRQVSVTPLTIDVTAHAPGDEILRRLPPL